MRLLDLEVRSAADELGSSLEILKLGPVSALTCPECHGILVQVQEGGLIRFRCHTGHAYTASSLAESVSEGVERNLYQVVRSLEEAVLLYGQLEQHHQQQGEAAAAEHCRAKVEQATRFADQVKAMTSRPVTGPDRPGTPGP